MSTSDTESLHRLEVDLAILGGDIACLTTALVAARAGLRVVVCSPTDLTGRGWAEVSLLQGDRLHPTRDLLGDDVLTGYLQIAMDARLWLDDFLAGPGSEVLRRPVTAGAWVADGHQAVLLHQEAQALRLADITAQFDDESELPFPVRPVLTLPDQLLIERDSYLTAMVDAVTAAGAEVLTEARLVSGTTHEFVVQHGEHEVEILASRVVVGDGVPAPTRSPLPRGSVIREYAVELESDHPIENLWYGLEDSFTVTPGFNPGTIIVSGAAHPGSVPRESELAFSTLIEFGRQRFGTQDALGRWSRLYSTSTDRLPLVGPAGVLAPFIFVLGGIDRWDLLTGTAAGLQLGRYLNGTDTELPWSPVHARGGSPKAIVARLRAWLPGPK
ncbi:NAD(P)/FAD-dependent oxidoreductase [Enemella sp. A6]|uniref:NAD(P)/FAD-dependent oxidoreductase n=1 Tax=Enemella sp. A6 TaxID=3440152 RepID=UPI003EB8A506